MVVEALEDHWAQVRDGDPRVLSLFARHYSARHSAGVWRGYRNGRGHDGGRIVGPGERLVLLTPDGRGLFVWRRQRYRLDQQTGVNCAVFRNEGPTLSSALILEAEGWAWQKWPGERLFTFVDSTKVRSTNPGFCFLKAGWVRVGHTPKGLLIMEKLHHDRR